MIKHSLFRRVFANTVPHLSNKVTNFIENVIYLYIFWRDWNINVYF